MRMRKIRFCSTGGQILSAFLIVNMADDASSGDLGQTYVLRYRRKEVQGRQKFSARVSNDTYESQIKQLASFSSLEEFWRLYAHLKRPGEFDRLGDLTIFKEASPPIWEDASNKHGGRLVFRTPKLVAARYWEEILFAFLGRQFEEWEYINGVCCNVRHNQAEFEVVIVIWTATSEPEVIESITHDMRRVLVLPARRRIAFKSHRKYYGRNAKKAGAAASSNTPEPSADAPEGEPASDGVVEGGEE